MLIRWLQAHPTDDALLVSCPPLAFDVYYVSPCRYRMTIAEPSFVTTSSGHCGHWWPLASSPQVPTPSRAEVFGFG